MTSTYKADELSEENKIEEILKDERQLLINFEHFEDDSIPIIRDNEEDSIWKPLADAWKDKNDELVVNYMLTFDHTIKQNMDFCYYESFRTLNISTVLVDCINVRHCKNSYIQTSALNLIITLSSLKTNNYVVMFLSSSLIHRLMELLTKKMHIQLVLHELSILCLIDDEINRYVVQKIKYTDVFDMVEFCLQQSLEYIRRSSYIMLEEQSFIELINNIVKYLKQTDNKEVIQTLLLTVVQQSENPSYFEIIQSSGLVESVHDVLMKFQDKDDSTDLICVCFALLSDLYSNPNNDNIAIDLLNHYLTKDEYKIRASILFVIENLFRTNVEWIKLFVQNGILDVIDNLIDSDLYFIKEQATILISLIVLNMNQNEIIEYHVFEKGYLSFLVESSESSSSNDVVSLAIDTIAQIISIFYSLNGAESTLNYIQEGELIDDIEDLTKEFSSVPSTSVLSDIINQIKIETNTTSE